MASKELRMGLLKVKKVISEHSLSTIWTLVQVAGCKAHTCACMCSHRSGVSSSLTLNLAGVCWKLSP